MASFALPIRVTTRNDTHPVRQKISQGIESVLVKKSGESSVRLALPNLKCRHSTAQVRSRVAPYAVNDSGRSESVGMKGTKRTSIGRPVMTAMDLTSFRTCAAGGASELDTASTESSKSTTNSSESFQNSDSASTAGKWHDVITPLAVARLGFMVVILGFLLKLFWTVLSNTIFHPRLILYATWFLAYWPWPTAVALGAWCLSIATKVRSKRAAAWEQVVLVGGALTWLILVPCGHFQGYVDGWPLVLYGLYALFCGLNPLIRLRLYGSLRMPDSSQWVSNTSQFAKVAFAVAISSAHWLAAQEAFQLEKSMPVSNFVALFCLIAACLGTWEASYYLGKYSDQLVVPRQVVTYGPYRWVRHPMYSWQVVMWVGYCLALRSYKSLALILVASYAFFQHATQKEEELLEANFGESYSEYTGRVTKKFVPYMF